MKDILLQLAPYLLTILVGFIGKKYASELGKVKETINDVIIFLDKLDNALEDDKISKEELKALIEAGKEIVR